MKNFIIVLGLILCYSIGFSQITLVGDKYQSEKVIEIQKKSTDITSTIIEYCSANVLSDGEIITYKSEDKIIIKGYFNQKLVGYKTKNYYTCTFLIKDLKFKYTFTNFIYIDGRYEYNYENKNMGMKNKIFEDTQENIDILINGIINSKTSNW